MSFFVFLHLLFSCFLFLIWIYTYKKYSEYSWLFFIVSTCLLWIWFIFYVLIFWFIIDKDILLYIFRIMYTLSFTSFYLMIFYIYFFSQKVNIKIKAYIFLSVIWIAILFILTPFVVENLKFIEEGWYYFEEYGIGYNLLLLLYFLYIPILLIISYFKIKSLNNINKIRLKMIVIWYSIFIFSSLLFYLFLPYFSIYLFPNTIILFSIPFMFSVLYATNYYNFFDFKIKLWEIFVFFLSVFWSVLFINIFKYYDKFLPNDFSNFWWITQWFWIIDIFLSIVLFLIFYKLFNKVFLLNNNIVNFQKKLYDLRKYIPYISNLDDLNIFLSKKFINLFKIKYINLKLFNKNDINLEIYNYFDKDISRNLFINDIVFIEENKNKFNIDDIKNEIENNIALIFPLRDNKWVLMWIIEIWHKYLKEQYYSEDIDIIKDFVEFLSGHLKYIEIYSKINDLNLNLDKKVDEKTMQINQLVNRQTEFISMASHEIKSPLWTSIFQLDYIIDEINEWNLTIDDVKKELSLLNKTLIKVWDLTNKIFTVQKYDLDKIKLYIQKIDIVDLFDDILLDFTQSNKNIIFDVSFPKKNIYINIDKIQFTQVIDNLISNAIKFASKKEPKIMIKLFDLWTSIEITIEDNWVWFKYNEAKDIFEKYKSWKKSVWIWLWLYLCKRIVELHNWIIEVSNSKELKWAKFTIIIPKESLITQWIF